MFAGIIEMEIVFWLSVAVIVYTFGGYYVVLKILIFLRSPRRNILVFENYSAQSYPKVSILVAAHNEEKVIKERILNLLELNYPKEKLEIIIASDGSTDRTVQIAQGYESSIIKILDFKNRRGKAITHNKAIKECSSEIIVFSDAETLFDSEFLTTSIRNFNDPHVGGVVGRLIYRTEDPTGISKSELSYWSYELNLRRLESEIGILAVGTGACLVAMKKLIPILKKNEDMDDVYPYICRKKGYRIILEPNAIAYDRPPTSVKSELAYRVRGTAHGFTAVLRNWQIDDIICHPVIFWEILSHRILRWLTPYFIILIFLSNLFLWNENLLYTSALLTQVLLYIAAFVGYLTQKERRQLKFFSEIFTFCVANLGIMIGTIKAILGRAPSSYEMPD